MKKRIHVFYMLLVFAIAFNDVSANNITVSNVTLTGQNITALNNAANYTRVKCDISWDNSWRTTTGLTNYDAAWVFVKYKVGSGAWAHATLSATALDHTAPAGSTITPSADGKGAFIYRTDEYTGTNNFTSVELRWNYGANGVLDADVITVQVFAIEMVYVPAGSFYAGDGTVTNITGQFHNANSTAALQITGEGALTLGGEVAGNLGNNNTAGQYSGNVDDFNTGATQTLPANFPKGYNAFYCMKYELSQGQYVEFLKTLTQVQATARKYDIPGTPARYAITGDAISNYATTNPYVAMNWVSWADLTAYLDWSGLRPMTELEYEKACRGAGAAVANEYAWGTADKGAVAYTLSNAGLANEVIATSYSVSGNSAHDATASTLGPLRGGIFAGTSENDGRVTAGASYYGILEMSGNTIERVVNVGTAAGRAYTGTHGDGVLAVGTGIADAATWPAAATAIGAGFRGGSFMIDYLKMRISDRTFSALAEPSRAIADGRGGRGVRTAP